MKSPGNMPVNLSSIAPPAFRPAIYHERLTRNVIIRFQKESNGARRIFPLVPKRSIAPALDVAIVFSPIARSPPPFPEIVAPREQTTFTRHTTPTAVAREKSFAAVRKSAALGAPIIQAPPENAACACIVVSRDERYPPHCCPPSLCPRSFGKQHRPPTIIHFERRQSARRDRSFRKATRAGSPRKKSPTSCENLLQALWQVFDIFARELRTTRWSPSINSKFAPYCSPHRV